MGTLNVLILCEQVFMELYPFPIQWLTHLNIAALELSILYVYVGLCAL